MEGKEKRKRKGKLFDPLSDPAHDHEDHEDHAEHDAHR
jgi:hypothetical protein